VLNSEPMIGEDRRKVHPLPSHAMSLQQKIMPLVRTSIMILLFREARH
jgi:hypothetical protein